MRAGEESGPAGPILSVRKLSKAFDEVPALRDVSFDLYPGEVLALAGDNGAGKSTLIKAVSGAHRPDAGTIVYKGVPRRFESPRQARDLGIETIFQDLALADNLDAAANIFLGRELKTWKFGIPMLNRPKMRRLALQLIESLDMDCRLFNRPVRDLSGGQRQAVAIARALYWKADMLVMDEPTAALAVPEQLKVLNLIRRAKDEAIAVLFISHDLTEVLQVCDRVMVLRQGAMAGIFAAGDCSPTQLDLLMTVPRNRGRHPGGTPVSQP